MFFTIEVIIMSIEVMTLDEIEEVSGSRAAPTYSGYEGAGAIAAAVGFGSLFHL